MKPDLVGGNPDRSIVTVVGFDGFAGVFRRGAWSADVVGWLTDRDLDAIMDPAEVSKFSSEARTALPDVPVLAGPDRAEEGGP